MWGIRDRVRRLFGGLTGSVASAASNAPIVVSSTAVEVLILETSAERSGAKLEEGALGGVCGPTVPSQGSSVTAPEPEDGASGKDGALAATLGQTHPPIDNVIDVSFRLKASANPNTKGYETNLPAGGHDPNPPRRSVPRKCLALSENDVLIREHPETVVATKGYARKGWRIRARRVFEGVNCVAPAASVMASVAKAVPVLGTPVEGVLEAFVKVLHLIEQYYSNRDAILDLFERIERLRAQDRAPGASADSPARQRLLRQLDTAQLTLHSLVTSGASEAKITSVISDCSKKIDHYLVEVLVSNDEVHSEKLEGLKQDVSELKSLLVMMVNNASLQIATSPQLQGIIIVDPFGDEQIFAKLPGDIELVAKKVQDKYTSNPELYDTLQGFIGTHPSLYELTLDDGRDIHPVSHTQLATLEPGTKIVLRIVKVVVVGDDASSVTGVDCSSCGLRIALSANDLSAQRRVIWLAN
ncbi:hypothetical protein NMY22_g12416 [Coprinellus aureogranulatus]|nr:hypothetical protein NMY22_g12416 [Coprinellus aureogranulatus]